MAVAKEQIRQIMSENNIGSVADVCTLLKGSFKDILQELMEAELDATLGYEKNHKGNVQIDNKRNGHSTKNLKSQYGEFQIFMESSCPQKWSVRSRTRFSPRLRSGSHVPWTRLIRLRSWTAFTTKSGRMGGS